MGFKLNEFIKNISIKIDPEIFLKDPESSELGLSIIKESIDTLYKIGYDDFNFKKLSDKINTSEASIYRYFENKHRLLLYLINWFWLWMEYRLIYSAIDETGKRKRIEKAIVILCTEVDKSEKLAHIDVYKLYHIVISDVSRHYFKGLKNEECENLYHGYYSLCQRLSHLIHTSSPNYKNPLTLSSAIIDMVFFQKFLIERLPGLTDLEEKDLEKFFIKTVFKILNYK